MAATVRRDPAHVLLAGLGNTAEQLHRVALGEVLTRAAMGPRIGQTVARFLGPDERDRLLGGRQVHDTLAPLAERLNRAHAVMLVLGFCLSIVVLIGGRPGARGFAACILLGVLANAVATGALSGPHDRYQARIVWIVLIPAMLLTPPTLPPHRATSAPASRRRRAASL